MMTDQAVYRFVVIKLWVGSNIKIKGGIKEYVC